MKKLIVLISIVAVAGSASADITGWADQGGKLFDNGGAQVTSAAGVQAWSIAGDITGLIIDGTIDEGVLVGALAADSVGFAPPFLGGTYAANFGGDGSLVGTRTDFFQIGDKIGIIAVNSIIDLDPGGAPPLLPQEFATGDVTCDIQIGPAVGEYWLDVTVVGGGSLNVADGWHPAGTNLALTGTPNAGWLFMGWSEDLIGDYTQTNTTLLINGDKSITATFSNDADGDGLMNTEENSLGTDPRDTDSDDDGLLDAFEVYIHNTDPLDPDTDDDSLFDGLEVSLYETDPVVFDSDGDGLGDGDEVFIASTNPLNPDTDGDGLSDGDEMFFHFTDPLLTDTDGDSLSDYEEVVTYNTNPKLADTDADGLGDYAELNTHLTDPNNADSDGDGLSDGDEINSHSTDPLVADSDGDGLSDSEEINIYNTNPNLGDTSGDGILDGYAVLKGLDPTVDQTGIYAILNISKVGFGEVTPDSDLYTYGTNLTLEATGTNNMLFVSWSGSITGDYTSAITNIILNGHMDITATFSDDADGDGILNTNETALGTNPRSSDTDWDGLSDSEELYTYLTDPLNGDTDGDGLSDGREILTYNTDPLVTDTDLDGFSDGYEVNTGYDPALASSTPEAVMSIYTAVEIHFNAASGSVYRIEGTDSLSNSWSTVESGIPGNGAIIQRLYSTLDQSNRFFRAIHE